MTGLDLMLAMWVTLKGWTCAVPLPEVADAVHAIEREHGTLTLPGLRAVLIREGRCTRPADNRSPSVALERFKS